MLIPCQALFYYSHFRNEETELQKVLISLPKLDNFRKGEGGRVNLDLLTTLLRTWPGMGTCTYTRLIPTLSEVAYLYLGLQAS